MQTTKQQFDEHMRINDIKFGLLETKLQVVQGNIFLELKGFRTALETLTFTLNANKKREKPSKEQQISKPANEQQKKNPSETQGEKEKTSYAKRKSSKKQGRDPKRPKHFTKETYEEERFRKRSRGSLSDIVSSSEDSSEIQRIPSSSLMSLMHSSDLWPCLPQGLAIPDIYLLLKLSVSHSKRGVTVRLFYHGFQNSLLSFENQGQGHASLINGVEMCKHSQLPMVELVEEASWRRGVTVRLFYHGFQNSLLSFENQGLSDIVSSSEPSVSSTSVGLASSWSASFEDRKMTPLKLPKCPNSREPPRYSFDKFNHWKLRMLAHLNSIDERMQDIIIDGPHIPMMSDPLDPRREVHRPRSLWSKDDWELVMIDRKAQNQIFKALDDNMFEIMVHTIAAKEAWDALMLRNEGTNEIRENKKDVLIQQYELVSMRSDENLTIFFERFNIFINNLKTLEKTFENKKVNLKFVRSFGEI
ncbi:hypothetical protein AKJ16_DCAP10058 [Drosera capensis]